MSLDSLELCWGVESFVGDEEEEEEEDDDGGYEEHYYHDRDQRGKKNQDVTWEGWNRDTSNKNQGTTEVWGGAEDWAAGGTSSWGDNNTNKQSKRQDPWSTRTERETWGDTTTENHDTGWGAQGGTQVQEGWGNVESWGANAGDQGKQKASEWPDDSAWAKENTTATKKRKGKKEEKKSAASEWPTSTNKEFDMQQLLQSMVRFAIHFLPSSVLILSNFVVSEGFGAENGESGSTTSNFGYAMVVRRG